MNSAYAHLEREAKLRASLDLALPDLRPLSGSTLRRPEEALETVYYDTLDFRLWARAITLRHRIGEGPPTGTWTLKLPMAVTARTVDRTELSWPARGKDVPAEARRLLRGLVRGADLRETVRLETVRRPLELRDTEGRRWAVLDDDDVTVRGGPRDGWRFREVEVELADDTEGARGHRDRDARRSQTAFRKVVAALEDAGARPHTTPKVALALDLATGGGRDGASHRLDQRSTLEALVRSSITAGLDRLLDNDLLLRLDPTDPAAGAVHQARVATRRLRADLKTFRPALDEVWTRHTRDELKWVGTALGRIRDADVLAASLGASSSRAPIDAAGRRELLARLGDQRRSAARHLAEMVDGDPRYLRLLDRLHAAGTDPPFRTGRGSGRGSGRRQPGPEDPARKVAPRLVRTSWRSLRRRVRRSGRRPSDRELHRIRIEAKQLRYACEATAPVVGRRARRTARGSSRIQRLLGDHHDAVTAEMWLRNEALDASPWASFAAGELTAEVRRRQRARRRRFARAWTRLDRPKVRGWLD